MTLQIDKAGRILLPKPVRDRLGLQPGSLLEMEETQGGVFLTPCEETPALVKKDGFWVYTGELPPGFDVRRAIEDDREERMRKVWGGAGRHSSGSKTGSRTKVGQDRGGWRIL